MTLVSRYSNKYFLSLEGSILRSLPGSFDFDSINPMRTITFTKVGYYFDLFGFFSWIDLLCRRMRNMNAYACLCCAGPEDR